MLIGPGNVNRCWWSIAFDPSIFSFFHRVRSGPLSIRASPSRRAQYHLRAYWDYHLNRTGATGKPRKTLILRVKKHSPVKPYQQMVKPISQHFAERGYLVSQVFNGVAVIVHG